MSKPLFNIGRLRADSGSEEVIPESSFDQYDGAPLYKLGLSVMSSNMTSADWPNSGVGVVNTSKSSDLFAVQSFQPLGLETSYKRRWDQTPIDFSDNFNQSNGTNPDNYKWTEYNTPAGIFVENNYLRFNEGGIHGNYSFIGDFDIQSRMYKEGVASSHLSFIIESPANKTSISGHAVDGFGIAALLKDSIYTYLTGSASSIEHPIPTGAIWYYIRIVRIGSWIDIYLGTDGINWGVPIRSGNHGVNLNGTGVLRVFQNNFNSSYPGRLDDFVINSGTVTPDSVISASWSDWIEVKSAEETAQETTDAITEHATVTYDHAQMVADITGKEDVGVAQTLIDALPAKLTRNITSYIDLTGGETVFDTTATFNDISEVDVYLNGNRLIANFEFTADVTNPTTHISLNTATVLGDNLEIITWI